MAKKPGIVVGEEKPLVELTIDGERVQAPEGTSVYDAVYKLGKTLPSMCYHYTFSPFGSCGICLVEVEGKKAPVRSCTAPVQADMVVRTGTPALEAAQKKAIERHLSTHPLDCPVCDADGFCELQDMSYGFGVSQLGNVRQKGIPEDTRSPVLDFNMNRCILCGQCINICKEVQMVDALQFLKKGGHTHVVAKGDTALHCEFCGDCLAVCPVGAITNKFSKYAYKPWQLSTTTTACAACGDGCTLLVDTKDDRVVRVRSTLTWKAKWGEHSETVHGHGGICGRGRFGFQYINSEERLKQPLLRKDGRLEETPWLLASQDIVRRLKEIKAQHGGRAIAGLITARCTNEDLYVFQKFMRMALGSNHIDSSARYGHVNFVLPMKEALGVGRGMVFSADLTQADAALVIGSDITETNPVAALRLKECLRNYEGKVIVAHPFKTNLAKLAAQHLALRPGSERAFIQGMIKSIVERDLADADLASGHPEALAKIREAVSSIAWESVLSATGLEQAALEEAAQTFAQARRGVIVLGEGITRRPGGHENTRLLMDLALVAGKLDRPGCGLTAMCEENNEQGAVEMGAVPEFLPGQLPFADAEARRKFQEAWGGEFPDEPGDTLLGILERARRGEIKALYLVGENPLETLPDSAGVREALERVSSSGGIVICQDLFLTGTGKLADAVLPACSFVEKDGTFTNFEGRMNPVRKAMECLGESKADWEIFCELAQALGYPLYYGGAEEILHEIAGLLPDFVKERSAPPQADLQRYIQRYLADGFARDLAARYAPPSDGAGDPAHPFTLVLGQILYHSGKLTTHDPGLMKIFDKELLQLHPADAQRLGVSEGDKVRVRSPLGSVEVGIELKEDLAEGTCFFPEHFSGVPVKDLLACETDPVSAAPYHKSGPVAIEKVTA